MASMSGVIFLLVYLFAPERLVLTDKGRRLAREAIVGQSPLPHLAAFGHPERSEGTPNDK